MLRIALKECSQNKVASRMGLNGWCLEIIKVNCLLWWWSERINIKEKEKQRYKTW